MSSIDKAASIQKQIEETRKKIIDRQVSIKQEVPEDAEAVYCDICYTNELTKPGSPVADTDTSTVELACEHRFCSECIVADLKHHIECAEIAKIKCLNFDCQRALSKAKV